MSKFLGKFRKNSNYSDDVTKHEKGRKTEHHEIKKLKQEHSYLSEFDRNQYEQLGIIKTEYN